MAFTIHAENVQPGMLIDFGGALAQTPRGDFIHVDSGEVLRIDFGKHLIVEPVGASLMEVSVDIEPDKVFSILG